jgi:hypothetical protein
VLLTGCSTVVEAQQPAAAPRYTVELLHGAGTPICDAYADWLRAGEPMTAVSTGFRPDLGERRAGFGREWQPLLSNVEQFVWERDANPARYFWIDRLPDWQRTPDQLREARELFHQRFEGGIGAVGYQLGSLDLDNDGTPENTLFSVRQSGTTLLVLNADRTDVDVAKTERILKHPSRAAAQWPDVRAPWPDELSAERVRPVVDAYYGARYGALLYEGTAYVWFAWDTHPQYSITEWTRRRTEHIYRTVGELSEEVCEFRRTR